MSENSAAADRFADSIVEASADAGKSTDVPEPRRESASDAFGSSIVAASDSLQQPEPEPPADNDISDEQVYDALGSDRRELIEFVDHHPAARLLPTEQPQTSGELARNIRLVETLKEGVESREELGWANYERQQEQALEHAQSVYEETGSALDALNAAVEAGVDYSGRNEDFAEFVGDVAAEDPGDVMIWQANVEQCAQQEASELYLAQRIAARRADEAQAAVIADDFFDRNPDFREIDPLTASMLMDSGSRSFTDLAQALPAAHAAAQALRGQTASAAFADSIISAGGSVFGVDPYGGYGSKAAFEEARQEANWRALDPKDNPELQRRLDPPMTIQERNEMITSGIVAAANDDPVSQMFSEHERRGVERERKRRALEGR